jgi:TPR repeat protein
MSVKLTGYSKAIDPQTQVRQGLTDLRQADSAKAKEHLALLRTDLQSKQGVVRLLHTRSADVNKDMKFMNAGAFKAKFLNGDRLKQSGEVIADLLKSAGLSKEKVAEFEAYASARGNKGVKAQKVLQYIDTMHSEQGRTPEEAMSKFGVNLGALGKKLGSGAFGDANIVLYRGEEFVYKQPNKKGISNGYDTLGSLPLTDASGKPLNKRLVSTHEADNRRSYEPVESSPANRPSPLHKLGGQEIDPFEQFKIPSSQRPSFDEDRNSLFSPQQLQNYVWAEYDNRESGSIVGSPLDPPPIFESAVRAPEQMVPPIVEHSEVQASIVENAQPEPLIQEDLSGEALPLLDAQEVAISAPPAGPKLGREGLGSVLRVRDDLAQVIAPTIVVVRETQANGTMGYHAVAGQRTLKDWVRTQATNSSFDVVGLLMPKAAGITPIEYKKGTFEPKLQVAAADLKDMAGSALKALQGLASHGFIHGDIKPENLLWDDKTKTLQLIDNDNLQKVSKKVGAEVSKGIGVQTLTYTNPVAWLPRNTSKDGEYGDQAQMGLGRDLFAMGMVLLEASLLAKGQGEKANSIFNKITFSNKDAGDALDNMRVRMYKMGLKLLKTEEFPKGSVEDFARSCIVKAVAHEEARYEDEIGSFERYKINDPANDQHLLTQLQREFEQLT